jgi:hypothetical protein
MSISIRIGDDLYAAAKAVAKAECRSVAGQIEFWARLGKAALDNPDLPVDFVRELLVSQAQDRDLAEPFVPEGKING